MMCQNCFYFYAKKLRTYNNTMKVYVYDDYYFGTLHREHCLILLFLG